MDDTSTMEDQTRQTMEIATAEPIPGHRAAQPEALLTVAELAEYLRMTPSTVYRMVERDQIPTLHLGVGRRSLRFRMADITVWLDSQQVADIRKGTKISR